MKKNKFRLIWIIVANLILGMVISQAVTASSPDEISSSIRYAEPDGLTMGNCLTWEQACDLQYALGIAGTGDQVWVTKGIYYPGSVATDSFRLKYGVSLYGGFPSGGGDWNQRNWTAYPTILSGDVDKNDLTEEGVVTDPGHIIGRNAYHVVTNDTTTLLDGFIITGGNANAENFFDNRGGGLRNGGTITLAAVIFSGNKANTGGGMANFGTNVTLTNVTFANNSVEGTDSSGGGLANNGSAVLKDVIFSDNQADWGGGMFNSDGIATLIDVTFSGNRGQNGGGLFTYYREITLTRVTFSGNIASLGGGMVSNAPGIATLTDVAFTDNMAYSVGGGIYNGTQPLILNNVSLTNNTATSNGGGLANWGQATLTNVTFSGNQAGEYGGGITNGSYATLMLTNVTIFGNSAPQYGGGLCNVNDVFGEGDLIIVNSILWGNSLDQISGGLSSVDITYSDIQGGWSGEGNINLNPLLSPLANNGGYTLTHALEEGSPAIDKGKLINCPPTDQRDYLRPMDGDGNGIAVCDMGAFEYGAHPFIANTWLYLPIVRR